MGDLRVPLTPYLRAEDKYRTDNHYRAVVDMLTSMIAKLEMTPTEVREAAIYACIRFEHLNMNSVRRYISRDGTLIDPRAEEDMRRELDRCADRARDLSRWLSQDNEDGEKNG
jgi:hypothetical protein